MGCVVVKYGKGVFPPLFVSKIATTSECSRRRQKRLDAGFQHIHSMIDVESVLPYNNVDIQQPSGVIYVQKKHIKSG